MQARVRVDDVRAGGLLRRTLEHVDEVPRHERGDDRRALPLDARVERGERVLGDVDADVAVHERRVEEAERVVPDAAAQLEDARPHAPRAELLEQSPHERVRLALSREPVGEVRLAIEPLPVERRDRA